MGRAILNELAGQLRQSYGEDRLSNVTLLNFDFASDTSDPAIEEHNLFADPSEWIFESKPRPSIQHWFDKPYYQQNLTRFSIDYLDRQLARLCLFRFIAQKPEYLVSLFEDRVGRIVHQRRLLQDTTELEQTTLTLPVYLVGTLTDPVMSGLYLDIAHVLRLTTRRIAETRIILSGGIAASDRTKLVELFTVLRELQRFGDSNNPRQLARRFVYDTSDRHYHDAETSQQLIYEVWLHQPENLNGVNWATMWADSLLPLLDLQFGENFMQALANKYAQRIENSSFFVSSLEAQTAIFPRHAILEHWSQRVSYSAFKHWVGEKTPSHMAFLERWAKGEHVTDPIDGTKIETPAFMAQVWQMNASGATLREITRHYQDSGRFIALLNSVVGGNLISDDLLPGSLTTQAEDYEPDQIESFHRFVMTRIKNTFSSLDKPQDFRQGDYWKNHHHQLEAELVLFRSHLYGWVLRLLQTEKLGIVSVQHLIEQLTHMLKQANEAIRLMLDLHQKHDLILRLPNRLSALLPYINKLPRRNNGLWSRITTSSNLDRGFHDYLENVQEISSFMSQWAALSLFHEVIQGCQKITVPLLEHLTQWKQTLVDLPTSLEKRLATAASFDIAQYPSRYNLVDGNWVQREFSKQFPALQIQNQVSEIQWKLEHRDQTMFFLPSLSKMVRLDWRPLPETQEENYQRWRGHFHESIYKQNSRLNLWTYLTDESAQHSNIQPIKKFFLENITPLAHLDPGNVGRVATTITWLLLPKATAPADSERSYRKHLPEALPSFTKAEVGEPHQTRITKLVFEEYIPLHGVEVYQRGQQMYFDGVIDPQQRHRTAIFPEEVQAIRREYDIEQYFRIRNFLLPSDLGIAIGNPEKPELFMWGHLLQFISIGSNIVQDFLDFCLGVPSASISNLPERIDERIQEEVAKWIADWRNGKNPFPDPEIGRMVEQLQTTACATLAARLGYERLLLAEYEKLMSEDHAALTSPNSMRRDLHRLLITLAKNGLAQRRMQIRNMLNSC